MYDETWKDVVSYEGLYQVSDRGRVKRLGGTPWCKKDRLLSLRIQKHGYVQVKLTVNQRKKLAMVHRLVLDAFVGPIPHGKETNHKDGQKANNTLENLEYITRSENLFHRYHVLGIGLVSITKVRKIRYFLQRNITQTEIAERVGVAQSLVSNISRGVHWSSQTR